MNKKVIKTIDSFEFSEIDFDLYDELFTKEKVAEIYNSNKDHPSNYIFNKRDPECDGEPINIDRLINKLNEFKNKGANYVALEYHCDHIGYILEAIKIENEK